MTIVATTEVVVQRLTATEARLAALVAHGRTDGEIAATLALTADSVEAAVAEVCRKLGLRSRAELAVLLGAGAALG